jgi:hypothetical protein
LFAAISYWNLIWVAPSGFGLCNEK